MGCNMIRTILIICLTVFMVGCGTIESFYIRPVIEDQMITDETGEQEIGTLAVTAQRRLIIGNLKTGNFCSEPPPEVADSITTALAAAFKANITQDKNVSAELASNFARHVNQLYKRSHTVQIFRDASFHMCVDAVNSANGDKEYVSYKSDVKEIVNSLISSLDKEVALYYETEKARAENPPKVTNDMIICDSSASVGDKPGGEEKQLSTSITCRPLVQAIKKKEEVK